MIRRYLRHRRALRSMGIKPRDARAAARHARAVARLYDPPLSKR